MNRFIILPNSIQGRKTYAFPVMQPNRLNGCDVKSFPAPQFRDFVEPIHELGFDVQAVFQIDVLIRYLVRDL